QWLGGNGVNIYYNGANGASVWGNDYVNGVYVGLEWQCVDLAGRLYNTRGWQNGAFYDNACDIYPHASTYGDAAYSNGGGYVPIPGDLVIWSAYCGGSGAGGHVAVVDYLDTGH